MLRWRLKRLPAQRALAAACACLALVIVVGAVLLIQSLYDRTMSDAKRGLTSYSSIVADQANGALQAVVLVQQTVLHDVADAADIWDDASFVMHMSRRSVHDALRSRIAALPQISAVTIIDSSGKLINSSAPWPVPNTDLAESDDFRELRDNPALTVATSQRMLNPADGTWHYAIARKITDSSGRFLGVVVGAIDTGYFERLWGRMVPSNDYAFAMFRANGRLIARFPVLPGAVGHIFPDIVRWGAMKGVQQQTSPIDFQDRLVATTSLSQFPILLSITRTVDATLYLWHRQAASLAIAAALLIVGLIGLLTLSMRQIANHERLAHAEANHLAAEERAHSKRVLLDQYRRFGTALDNMSQGLCMFGPDACLVVMNERFARMYALPLDLRQPGTPLASLSAHLATEIGLFLPDPRSRPDWADLREAAPAEDTACDLRDGRSINVLHVPTPEGGWICTHEDATDRKAQAAEIAFLARHDMLTGLSNRFRLREFMDEVLASPIRSKMLAVLYLDLDGFKHINDRFGHSAGDEVLRIVAQRLRDHTRIGDLIVRLGGDEFALVLVDQLQPHDATALADRLVAALSVPIDLGAHEVTIGTSIGVAVVADAPTAEWLLRSADIALYAAKAAGRGTWRMFDPAMDEDLQRRSDLENDLRRAFAEDQFELFYQPLVSADDKALRGCEALLRWNHPTKGLVPPNAFIPLTEETGLIRAIGRWVLERACADAAPWPDHVKVAVNLSPAQFSQTDIAAQVELALANSGLAPHRLELEITESVLLADNEATLSVLYRLRSLGVRIAMDDFGTGYSSLSYLRRFPFDKIKLDQSFVRNLEYDPESLEIVRAVVGLGKALNMDVLAEGVETSEQLDILRHEGFDELQGYLFGKPMPLADMNRFIASLQDEPARAYALGAAS